MGTHVLLLCAGLGKRLKPLTDVLPKCLVPIHGRPLLGIWLERLFSQGAEKVVVNCHAHSQLVIDYLSASPWRDRVKAVYEPELLGTGGTILANRLLFDRGEPFMVAHGDNLTLFDFQAFLKAHRSRPVGCCMTLMTFRTPHPESCGIIKRNHLGIVEGFFEKVVHPPSHLANAAVYFFEPDIFKGLAALNKTFIDLSIEIIPTLLGKISTFDNQVYHRDIGNLTSWREAQKDFPKNLLSLSESAWENILGKTPVIKCAIETFLRRDVKNEKSNLSNEKGTKETG